MKGIRLLGLYLLIITILLSTNVLPVRAIDISGVFSSEFTYQEMKNPWPDLDIIDQIINTTTININLSGFIKDYYYLLEVEGNLTAPELELQRLTVEGLWGPGVYQVGYRDWVWGKGFADTPTYPLTMGQGYWGNEWSAVLADYNLALGMVIDKKYDQNGAAWIKLASYGDKEYTLDLAYLSKGDIARGEINLGLDYARDLWSGFTCYGAANYNFSGQMFSYLLGGEYMLDNKMIIVEYFQQEKRQDNLMLAVNSTNLFSKFAWSIQEIYNISDWSRMEVINLSYDLNNPFTAVLEIRNSYGKAKSEFGVIPWSRELSLKLAREF